MVTDRCTDVCSEIFTRDTPFTTPSSVKNCNMGAYFAKCQSSKKSGDSK